MIVPFREMAPEWRRSSSQTHEPPPWLSPNPSQFPTHGSPMADLTALALNCTLKADGFSNTGLLLQQVLDELATHDVEGRMIRVLDHDVYPGTDGQPIDDGDGWRALRQPILDADILVIGTPIWLGNPSSVCRRVLERIDGFLSEVDDQGRKVTYGTVAGVAVTGNEDGAHNVAAQVFQGLNDAGYTIPANSNTYWVGEAMDGVDYGDLDETPEAVAATTAMMATTLAHVARLLKDQPYPPVS